MHLVGFSGSSIWPAGQLSTHLDPSEVITLPTLQFKQELPDEHSVQPSVQATRLQDSRFTHSDIWRLFFHHKNQLDNFVYTGHRIG